MIQKIDKIKVSTTSEQEELAWAEAMSHRNKLLLNSDWTQAPDSYLTERCVIMWRDWRKQVKNISRRNFSDRSLAVKHIELLAARPPLIAYSDVAAAPLVAGFTSSTDEYRARVITFLDDKFNKLLVPSFLSNPFLVEEQYQEGLDCLGGRGTAFPIIDATCNLFKLSREAIARQFLDEKSDFMRRAASLKVKYYEFHALVTKASNDVELEALKADIEKWTLT